jgi:hypothetical protein
MKIIYVLICIIASPYIFYSIARPQQLPCDESNRINKIRLFWFACTRSELFRSSLNHDVDSFTGRIKLVYRALSKEKYFVVVFPWLANDEFDNITGVK